MLCQVQELVTTPKTNIMLNVSYTSIKVTCFRRIKLEWDIEGTKVGNIDSEAENSDC